MSCLGKWEGAVGVGVSCLEGVEKLEYVKQNSRVGETDVIG